MTGGRLLLFPGGAAPPAREQSRGGGARTLAGMTGRARRAAGTVRPAPQEERGDVQDTIDLQDFLKLRGVVETGGEAKFRVQGGEVRLNGEVETRRRKKLRRGDVVEYAGHVLKVDF